jgi:preprotein translocase subunit SecG
MSETGEVLRTGRLISAGTCVEIREPHLDERPHGILEACLARRCERLLVARAYLLGRDPLLEAVVARPRSWSNGNARYHPGSMVSVFAVLQVLFGAALVTLVLMHSGRDAGFGGIGFTPTSQGGTHIVERNLTRLTAAVGVLFGINTVVLYRLLA